MNATGEILGAIYKVAKYFIFADGKMDDEEAKPLFDFYCTFPDVDEELLGKIMDFGENLTDQKAIELIRELDDDGKQQVSTLFARIICQDGELTEDEKSLFFKVRDLCNLPDPETPDDEEGQEPANEEDEENIIIPAFLIANFYGIASVKQSQNNNWSSLESELSSWIGTDGGVQIVRFTPALNKLSEELHLNERHLVFMVARNGYGDKTVGDNMTATILYGGGYPIYGNIVFALETDSGYEIEGFCTKSLLNETFAAINGAVGGLLRVQE